MCAGVVCVCTCYECLSPASSSDGAPPVHGLGLVQLCCVLLLIMHALASLVDLGDVCAL